MNRLVVWGARDSLDSIRHIFRAFHENALKLNIPSIWVNDTDPSTYDLKPGDTVIAADVTAKNLPYMREVNYCLHNFDGSSELCQALEQTPERLLRLQVWTTDANGEKWGPYRWFDREARTLFQPWGSDLLAEEFMTPVCNPESLEVSFVGAIWSDQYQGTELGNKKTIELLRESCLKRHLRFKHQTQISDQEMIKATREARLAPAFAGNWQTVHGYLPCRAFKTPSWGVLGFTNIPEMELLYGAASIWSGTVEETLDAALSLNKTRYLNLIREQQRVIRNYTYRESLLAISRAFEEISG